MTQDNSIENLISNNDSPSQMEDSKNLNCMSGDLLLKVGQARRTFKSNPMNTKSMCKLNIVR